MASGAVSAPIVIGRDHLDCGSVASPYRETEAMADGSDAIADWPLLNALVNTASGASWVSIHHGGGVGIGRSIHAGQVCLADGTELAAQKLSRVLSNDPGMGVIRHVDAGYDSAVDVADGARRAGAHARERSVCAARRSSRRSLAAARRDRSIGSGPSSPRSAATPDRRLSPVRPHPRGPRTARVVRRRGRSRGLDLTLDRMGNQWAWWGDPDATPGVVTGSHLDSVPDGGAYDGPLGVVSAFAALDRLRDSGFRPQRPIGIVGFADEEGARFGVACAGSRVITGALAPERALGLRDGDGVSMAEALRSAGRDPELLGPDPETLRRVGAFVELHVEQGRGLIDLDQPVALGTDIWPHGRWRLTFPGEANHAGTTRLDDRQRRHDRPASAVLAARLGRHHPRVRGDRRQDRDHPGGVNAIPSAATAWLDARGADEAALRRTVAR